MTSVRRQRSSTRERRTAGPGRLLAHGLAVAFVAFHLFAILLFSFPVDAMPLDALRGTLAPYMRSLGLTEMWDTFAPVPQTANQFLKAVVIVPGAGVRTYSFPRMEELSLWARYREERYRKFTDSILCAQCSGLWPDVAREVVRRTFGATNQPARVLLIEYQSPIDPKAGLLGDDEHAKANVLTEQVVEPEDLR
jgi:hypothetical protein